MKKLKTNYQILSLFIRTSRILNTCKVTEKMLQYIWSRKDSELTKLSAEEYYEQLINLDKDVAQRAFEKSWETRNFEIEMYWKRATYFWAFIASTFVGYFALISSDYYQEVDNYNHVEVYFLICIGFVLSLAWHLTNIGSKTWQKHWEVHVDLLENRFTGPLYKTVYQKKTFSVSKINEIVSLLFVIIWLMLGVKYLLEQNLICSWNENYTINWFVVVSSSISVLLVVAMFKGHGRGRFETRPIEMYRRNVQYKTSKTTNSIQKDDTSSNGI